MCGLRSVCSHVSWKSPINLFSVISRSGTVLTSTAPTARLHLFGGASLETTEGPVSGRGAQRRRLALLAILACSRRAVSRDKLVAYLWEDADTERARKLLSESIYVIRKALGEDALLVAGDTVELNARVVWSDVAEFSAALEQQDDGLAVQLYRGPLLDGFFVSDAPEFESWAETERGVYARRRAEALARLTQQAEAARDYTGAARWWRQLAEYDPFNGTYAVGLMRALDASGDRAGALQHARVHAALMRSEFDADADAEVTAFAQTLQSAQPATRPALRVTAPAPLPSTPEEMDVRQTPRRARLAIAVGITGAVILGAIALSLQDPPPPAAKAASTTTVAVFPFTVHGPDEALRDGMVDLLSTNLNGAGDIRSINSHAILSSLMEEPTPIAPERASRIARRFGASHYVLGDVTRAGTQLQINATLYDATGAVTQAATRGPADSLLVLADRLTVQLLAGRVEEADLTRLAAHTTSSYPALKHYLEGESHYRAARYNEAVRSFVKAIQADPKFALADYRLSASAEFSFDFLLARRAARRALDNSERLPERERLLLRAWTYFLNGNPTAAQREYDAVLSAYPGDIEARAGLGETLVHYNPTRGLPASAARSAFARVLAVAPAYGEVRYHSLEFAARERNQARFDSLFNQIEPDNQQFLAWQAVRAFTWGDHADRQRVMAAARKADELKIGIAAARLAAHTNDFDAAELMAKELTRPDLTAQWRAGGHLILAELYAARGMKQEAERQLQIASGFEPDWPNELRALFALHPSIRATPVELAALEATLRSWNPGAHSPSLSFFLAAHAKAHKHLRLYLLGLINLELGRLAETEALRSEIAQLRGDEEGQKLSTALSRSLAGHIARKRGDREQAVQLLTTAVIDAPPEFLALSSFYSRAYDRWVIAELYRESGNVSEAKRWYESLLEGYDFIYVAPARERLRS